MTGNEQITAIGNTRPGRDQFVPIQHTNNVRDQGLILRTRSLDEVEPNLEHRDENQQNGSPRNNALHSSFDAAMLDSDHNCDSMFSFEPKRQQEVSWGDVYPPFGDISGKKHLRQHAAIEATETVQPGTVRKLPRRSARESSVSKTPNRSYRRLPGGSSVKKPAAIETPTTAAKRRRAVLQQQQRRSPMRRVPPTTPSVQRSNAMQTPRGMPSEEPTSVSKANSIIRSKNTPLTTPLASTPTKIAGEGALKSTTKWHTRSSTVATAASTLLETTIESVDSVDTSSPTATRFRFTSFPASLPRLNSSNPGQRQCPDSVRKRMSFGGNTPGAEAIQSREDDGTQNTSISSLSAEGGHQIPNAGHAEPPAVLEWKAPTLGVTPSGVDTLDRLPTHPQVFMDEEDFGYSDDDDDGSVESPTRGGVERTRLNFNLVFSPSNKEKDDIDLKGENTLMPLDLNMDLAKPYDHRKVNSFPSSLSSTTAPNISGFDEHGVAPPGSLTPARTSEGDQPRTPRDLQLHFQFETAQCSPIPGFLDEDDARGNDQTHAKMNGSCSMIVEEPRHFSTNLSYGTSSTRASKSRDESLLTPDSTNGKVKRLRPLPDSSAFETVAASSRGDRSTDETDTFDSKGVASPRLLCPPTPVRTPAWASDIGGHAILGRQNSLTTTKVLLTCPSQVLEGRCSLENSMLDDDNSKTSLKFPSAPSLQSDSKDASMEAYEKTFLSGATGVDNACRSAGATQHLSPHPNDLGDQSEANIRTPQVRVHQGPKLLPRYSASTGGVSSVVSFSNDFDTLGPLGRGSFADVYKVRARSDNRLYAVKRNRRQFRGKRDRDKALAEVRSMQRLQSVCAEAAQTFVGGSERKTSYCLYLLFFYRAWQEDGYLFCQTELCCRDTCRELIDSMRSQWVVAKKKYPSLVRHLPLPEGVVEGSEVDNAGRLVPNFTIWKICHDISAGLSHIHSHGIVHHDIKPSNIFFVSHGRFGAMCKIGDFGMAGQVGTSEDGQEGDAKYMPPELLTSGARHPSSDIFSLGLTLYELSSHMFFELPSEGPRWHELRDGAHTPDLPDCRGNDLVKLIELMTSPCEKKRPSAESILSNEKVVIAGSGCDEFLRDYVRDVDEFDLVEEQRQSRDQHDQTPQNSGHRMAVRSPSMSMILQASPNLFSPGAPAPPVGRL